MNIHFSDEKLFEKLKKATIAKVIVGSHLYGTNVVSDEYTSDTDFLYIYATSENELKSFVQVNHQLQYKEDGIDHNFVSLHSFIRNSLNGDSTINFEVIQSGILSNTSLKWLDDCKEIFKTYTITRSFLGLARRDVKHFGKYTEEYEKRKRFGHIIRGFLYSRALVDHNFNFNELNNELKELMNSVDYNSGKELKRFSGYISDLREVLTEKFNSGSLGMSQNINVDSGVLLDKLLNNYCEGVTFSFKQAFLKDFDMRLYINSYENWVNY